MTIQYAERTVPFVDLGAQYSSIKYEVDRAILRVVANSEFILGPDLKAFEEEFAEYCEADYAVGLDSGTSALELALRAFHIGEGDEVITVANTFIATTLAITYVGAIPVLVDCSPDTYNIEVSQIEKAISRKTKAIIPVHLYGQPADMDPILEIARKHSLFVIEDACQAHGARYKGKRTGSMGDATAFSFYPAKNLGAYGDGGMVVTNNAEIAASIRQYRDYGQSKKYHHDKLGANRRLDTIQAAVLRVKLPYLDGWNDARRQNADLYNFLFSDSPEVVTPAFPGFSEPVWYLYVIQVDKREELRSALSAHGISTGIHYPIPIHLQSAYEFLCYSRGSFPATERCAGRILSLPMYAELTPEMIEYCAQMVKEFC